MRAFLSRARTALPYLASLAILFLPAVLLAQGDSTSTVPDKTGIGGAVIDHWFLPVVALLQSGFTKLIAFATPGWQKLNQLVQWTILYVAGIVITFVGIKLGWVGFGVTGDTLAQLGTAGVLAVFPTGAAGLIYKISGHKVPVTS